MTLRIDLLAIDLAAGQHWMQLVAAENAARRRAAIRAKHRAAWLRRMGRHDGQEGKAGRLAARATGALTPVT